MKKVEKERFNFCEQTAFNGVPCGENEVLLPVVLSEDMVETLNGSGFNKKYAKTWKFKGAKKKVPVAFVPWPKELEEEGIKLFYEQVSDYLKQYNYDKNVVSLDELEESEKEDDSLKKKRKRFKKDPLATRKFDEIERYKQILEYLLQRLEEMDPIYAEYIFWKEQGYNKKEVLEILNLGVKKSQAYDIIKKIETKVYEIIEEL